MPDIDMSIMPGDGFLSNGSGAAGGNAEGSGSNELDPIMQDLQTVFGKEDGDKFSDGGQKNRKPDGPTSKQTLSFSDEDPFGDKNAPKNPEELLKRLQSERDSFRAKYEKIEPEWKQYKPTVEFVNSLWDDEAARHAFIAELEPNLVKPKNPMTFIQEKLKEEFGNEFTPNPEEAGIFGSPTWVYNERARDLMTEYKENSKKLPASLKELKEQRIKAKQQAAADAAREKRETIETFKWDDNTWDEFAKWAQSVKLVHLGHIYNNIKGKRSPSSPSIAGQAGGRPMTANKMQAELDELFGK